MAFPFRKKTDEEKAVAAARAEQSQRLRELEKAAKRQQKEARALEKAAVARDKKQLKEARTLEKQQQKEVRALEKAAVARDKQQQKEVRALEKQQQKEGRALEKQRKKEVATLEKAAKRADKRARREHKQAAKAAKRASAKAAKAAKRRRRRARRPTGQDGGSTPTHAPFAKRDHCHACARAFTTTRRRHHCRLCRASCCLDCVAATRRALPTYARRRPQKVCVVCDVLVFSVPDAPTSVVAPPPTTTAPPAALPVEQPSSGDNSGDSSLAAPLVRLAVSGRSTRRPKSAPLPGRSAPVVRVSTRRPPLSTPKPSRWMGLKRKASATRMRWSDPIPVGRKRLDMHLAKTAELLARGPSRAIELRVEQPHEVAAVAV